MFVDDGEDDGYAYEEELRKITGYDKHAKKYKDREK